ncbi:Lipoamide acyltransferase component of branched-chain alpha-keto acid dehydrogenase complex, mitochondrial [Trichinella papuae]|uniref:Dihydrolipoamide acetyltransferase component of pyruvate dehydrogenase complex n=1 Tax=Trichinella papuae TaxID=268474 RepID=A0A0V1MEV2_9BILA|nr:Lipoamide acyltransferase component of branched-chain alpha-keto acid dehydrogenase complex, mitochondrial [Trichinella papuae]
MVYFFSSSLIDQNATSPSWAFGAHKVRLFSKSGSQLVRIRGCKVNVRLVKGSFQKWFQFTVVFSHQLTIASAEQPVVIFVKIELRPCDPCGWFGKLFIQKMFHRLLLSRKVLLSEISKIPWNVCKHHFHQCQMLSGRIMQIRLTDIGEGIAEVQMKQHVKIGDQIQEFENLCDVQSDKASVTITSRFSGTVRRLYCEVEEIVPVGSPLLDIETEDEPENMPSDKAADQSEEIQKRAKSDDSFTGSKEKKIVIATPSVRRLAMENKINLSEIKGTGPGGRIVKEDLLNVISAEADANVDASDDEKKSFSTTSALIQDQVIPIRGYRRAMVNADALIKLRHSFMSMDELKDVKITYLSIEIKALSLALLRFPMLNAYLNDTVTELICKTSHNISFAVDTPDGLVVPFISDCQKKSIIQIAKQISDLQAKALNNKLTNAELVGGTFTISNIGSIGGTYASPIIFPPQKLPRYDEQNNLKMSNIMPVSWAADHRIIDGATVAKFSNLFKVYLENPSLMLAELN